MSFAAQPVQALLHPAVLRHVLAVVFAAQSDAGDGHPPAAGEMREQQGEWGVAWQECAPACVGQVPCSLKPVPRP